MICSHPPCMNIWVKTVSQLRVFSTTQDIPGPKGTTMPGWTVPRSSPGIAPYLHTDMASVGSMPNPCSQIHDATFRLMMRNVAHAVLSVGLSSRIGIIRPHYFPKVYGVSSQLQPSRQYHRLSST